LIFLFLILGIIILVDETKSYCKPTLEQIEDFENDKLKNEDQQLQNYIKNIEEKRNKIKNIIDDNNNNNGNKSNKGDDDDDIDEKEEEEKNSKIKGFYPKINIKTSSKSLKWYNDDDNKSKTLESAKQSKVWTWPETPQEEYKYKIYCDLWNKGYFISSGLKFGGDYLLYPGKQII
jgi:tRNA-splicing endonuclease subunit Sen34